MKSPFDPSLETQPGPDFARGCRRLGIQLTDTQTQRLARFVDHLARTNQAVNLVRFPDVETLWVRHVLDSLTLTPLLTEATSLLDVGSGGGFPGIVIAIAASHLRRITLVEATAKKCRFLGEVRERLGLDRIEIVQERAEDAARHAAYRDQFDVVTARAVAALPTLLELTAPFARVGGRILAMKGARADQEIRDSAQAREVLGLALQRRIRPTDSSDSGSCILEFVKNAPTDAAFPRARGIPGKRPL